MLYFTVNIMYGFLLVISNFEAFLVGYFSIFNMQIRTISAPQKEKEEFDIFNLYHQYAYC